MAQLSPVVDAEARQAAAADLEAAAALLRSRTRLKRGLAAAPVPTLYIWSSALLPKPEDWPQHVHVVGPLLLRRQLLPQAPPPLRPAPEPVPMVEVCAVVEEDSSIGATEEAAVDQAAAPARQPVRSCSSGGSAASDASSASANHIVPGTPASPDAAAPPSPGSDSEAGFSSGAASEAPSVAAGSSVAGKAASGTALPASPTTAAVPPPTQPAAAADPPVGLPADLQHYLDAALRRQLPVVYIGLGSMLATVFEPPQASCSGSMT